MSSMFDGNQMVEAIKLAALDVVESTYPVQVAFGTVTGTDPLQVRLSSQLTLTDRQLLKTSAVRDKTYTVPVPELGADIEVTLDDGLKLGETVLLLRVQGGQKYIIMDRVVI